MAEPSRNQPRGAGIFVRVAALRDAALLADIGRSADQAFRATPHAWLADEPAEKPDAYAPPIAAGRVRVAEFDGEVAGFVVAAPLGGALHVYELAVRHDRQRLGIGKALIAAARRTALAHGFRALTLTTFADVPFNAPFYARRGFRVLAAPPPHLAAILEAERARGLTDRCAMRAAFRS